MPNTYVDFATSLGDVVIQLFDGDAPLTVQNFLAYAQNTTIGAGYTGSFFHRLVPGFILQGGGYDYANGTASAITASAPVVNEFTSAHSNLLGTVAMAKLSGNPNSATDQFFFNLGDNSANLDAQNGGFTVFGQVTPDTLPVVQAIAGLQTVNAGGAFTNVPVQGAVANGQIAAANLVTINAVTVSATAPAPANSFLYTDTATHTSAMTRGDAYSGSVAGLTQQYLWPSPDGVAIAATVGNVFLHGGAGDDALQASSGTNVLDGATGSNFLVGATGADGGADTFFVDERGAGVTWSTVVNFHHGDAVTIFGYQDGVSTRPWTASDGAAGYQGATIHAELGGAGTGVNGSVTFAGISQADALARFTVTTGITGESSYLNIAYTG
ncbi:MAG TPA: peptidylprolyl isomerase [Acetobacteraceae bacterium]